MDYRKFLGRTETLILPYFGGARVEARDQRLRIRGRAEPGWWEFEVDGRRARPIRRTEPADLGQLPAVRGHYACGWLFPNGRELERIALPPTEEPEPLAPCTGRRWYGGEILLESVEFEDEAEGDARRALEEGRPLGDLKGVSPGLRAAFGYAMAAAAGQAAGVPISAREAVRRVREIAERGRPAAESLVAWISQERERQAQALRRTRLLAAARQTRPRTIRHRDPAARADSALAAAGARMLRSRRLENNQIEVTYNFQGERFISVADAHTLQVVDAGICLDGADNNLTLESLPSAIREAMDTGQLCITRH